jgi:uridine kinase
MKSEPYLVGICGASGSGKTYILNTLLEQFNTEELCLVSLDNYYKPREKQTKDEQGILNFDLPDSIFIDKCVEDLKTLKSGQSINIQEYTFNNPAKKPGTITLNPSSVIVVEGLFILHDKGLKDLLDLKVFIEAEDHIRLKRRILRDNKERGYDMGDVLYRYENHVFPAYQQFIAPYKPEADIILNNNQHFKKGLEVIAAFLRSKINR